MARKKPSDITILIVEDQAATLKIYSTRLTAEGFAVVATPSAHDVENLIETHHPHVCIVDIMLQDGHGFQVIKNIRAITGCEKTPIIVLSNLSQDADVDRAMKAGATEYLVKSNTGFQEIIDTILKHVN